MLLDTPQWKVLNPFVDETITALHRELGFDVESEAPFEEQIQDFNFKGYAVVINTTGDVLGRILIHHYTETAQAIANRLQDQEIAAPADDKVLDDKAVNILADFAHKIVASSVKALKASDVKVKVSPAYFIRDTQKIEGLMEGVQEIISVPLRIEKAGRFYINYLLNSAL